MIKISLIALALLMVGGSAVAQMPPPAAPAAAPAPPPPRARGLALALAVEAAQTAIATCAATTYNVTALVTDSAGVPVAQLNAEKAAART